MAYFKLPSRQFASFYKKCLGFIGIINRAVGTCKFPVVTSTCNALV